MRISDATRPDRPAPPVPEAPPRPSRLERLVRSPGAWLAVVAVAFAVVQLAVTPLSTYLSWDEAVYASRFSGVVPHVEAGAHRAIGTPLLLAPVTALTASVPVLRAYLAVLTALGLYLAFRPWLAFGRWAAPLAAALFAGAATTLENATQALPNTATALAAVAATGWFVRLATGERLRTRRAVRAAAAGLAVAFAVLALVRPTDSAWAALPLAGAALVVPAWRRPRVLLRCVAPGAAGLAVGALTWLVEAVVRYGGPRERLAEMSRTTAPGSGGVGTALAALHPAPPVVVGVLGIAAAVALVVLHRRVRHAAVWVTAIGVAVALGLPYLVLLSYASERYLLPPGALLALPVAAGIAWTVRRAFALLPARPLRVALAGLLALLALVVGATQVTAAHRSMTGTRDHRVPKLVYARELERLGVTAPCLVSGDYAPQLAYVMRCDAGDIVSAVPTDASRAEVSARDRARARAEGATYVEIVLDEHRPPHLDGWRRVVLHDPADTAYAYFPPGSRP